MKIKQLLASLFLLLCYCSAQGQVVFGVFGGGGLPIYNKSSKDPGDPKTGSVDVTPLYGGSIMVYAGYSIGLGASVHTQNYSFTMHNGQSNSLGYSGTDLVHNSNYVFLAPTLSFILDTRDVLQINLSPAIGLNTSGKEYVKSYAIATNGATISADSTNTTENIQQLVFGATAQFQQNIILSTNFRLCFIESYNYMVTNLTQTNEVGRNINPGYASVMAAFTYRIHKRNVRYEEPRFR